MYRGVRLDPLFSDSKWIIAMFAGDTPKQCRRSDRGAWCMAAFEFRSGCQNSECDDNSLGGSWSYSSRRPNWRRSPPCGTIPKRGLSHSTRGAIHRCLSIASKMRASSRVATGCIERLQRRLKASQSSYREPLPRKHLFQLIRITVQAAAPGDPGAAIH